MFIVSALSRFVSMAFQRATTVGVEQFTKPAKDMSGIAKDVVGARRDVIETRVAHEKLREYETRLHKPTNQQVEQYDPKLQRLLRKVGSGFLVIIAVALALLMLLSGTGADKVPLAGPAKDIAEFVKSALLVVVLLLAAFLLWIVCSVLFLVVVIIAVGTLVLIVQAIRQCVGIRDLASDVKEFILSVGESLNILRFR